MRSSLRFAAALLRTNLKATLALRVALWTSAAGMVLNNLLFFTMWWIFFDRFDEIRGWRIADMAALFGIVATGFGCAMLFAGGVRELARYIREGELDAFLCQPKPVLLQAVGSKSWASGIGDIGSGWLLVALSGHLRVETLPAVVAAMAISACVFTASGVILHSLAFWLGRIDTLARQAWEFLVTFSTYPQAIFGGALKFVLFTIVPAGFIGYLPVELVRDFHWAGFAAALGGAVVYATLAITVFAAGLRRYESGSRFGTR